MSVRAPMHRRALPVVALAFILMLPQVPRAEKPWLHRYKDARVAQQEGRHDDALRMYETLWGSASTSLKRQVATWALKSVVALSGCQVLERWNSRVSTENLENEAGKRPALAGLPGAVASLSTRCAETDRGGARAPIFVPPAPPPGPAPESSTAPVRIWTADSSETLEVEVDGQRCRTPCALQLQPGLLRLTTAGKVAIQADVKIPWSGATIELHSGYPARRAHRIAGAVLVPGGAVVMLLTAAGLACPTMGCFMTFIILGPIIGGSSIITGVGLLAHQARHRPRAEVTANRPWSARLRLTSLAIAPTPTGVQAGIAFSF